MGSRFSFLRDLERAATPAPWATHLVDDTTVVANDGTTIAETFPDGGVDDDVDFHAPVEQMERDAAFIVAARNHIPELIAECERLREALEDIGVYGCGMLNQPASLNEPNDAWLTKRIAEYERRALAALKDPTDA